MSGQHRLDRDYPANGAPKVGFFLGSGCSFPSGQPSVQAITKHLLEGNVYLDESGLYHFPETFPRWCDGDFPRLEAIDDEDLAWARRPALSIQKLLGDLTNSHLWAVPPHYEDLCGVLSIIGGAEKQKENNPFIIAFEEVFGLKKRVSALDFPTGHQFFSWSYSRRLAAINDFITWIVANRIAVDPVLKGYDGLTDFITRNLSAGGETHIATTNYDFNIELALNKENLAYDYGFIGDRGVDDSEREWLLGRSFEFRPDPGRIALLKLHGSLNWHALVSLGAYGSYVGVCKHLISPAEGYFTEVFGLKTYGNFTSNGSPELLTGTLSKTLEYSYGIYNRLIHAFDELLAYSDVLVISGFGWGDDGLVGRLIRYSNADATTTIILDENIKSPAYKRRPDIDPRRFGAVGSKSDFLVHPHYLCSMSGNDLQQVIATALAGRHRQ